MSIILFITSRSTFTPQIKGSHRTIASYISYSPLNQYNIVKFPPLSTRKYIQWETYIATYLLFDFKVAVCCVEGLSLVAIYSYSECFHCGILRTLKRMLNIIAITKTCLTHSYTCCVLLHRVPFPG